jgi:hypothetical protein
MISSFYKTLLEQSSEGNECSQAEHPLLSAPAALCLAVASLQHADQQKDARKTY